jgi:hypothetical protein
MYCANYKHAVCMVVGGESVHKKHVGVEGDVFWVLMLCSFIEIF